MNHVESIELGINAGKPFSEIIRKVYLVYPTSAFIGIEEREFEIRNEISDYFKIPIMNIQVAGSAKTGVSFHKHKNFTLMESDLDIAIINSNLFLLYSELVFKITKGFTDRSKFSRIKNISTFDNYTSCISKGIFRPDLMPYDPKRADWFHFFGKLSKKHKDIFKSINAGIYLSEVFFEQKQHSVIREYLNNKIPL